MSTGEETVDFRTTLEAERLVVAERAVEGKAPRPPMGDTWWRHVVAILAVIVAVFPAVYVVSAAFNADPSISSATLIPRELTLDNFKELFNPPSDKSETAYPMWFLNSIFIATFTAFFTVIIGALAAYAFSRFRFQGRRMGLLFLLLIQMFPQLLMLVAIYLIVLRTGEVFPALGLNHLLALGLVYLGGAMGVNVWLMKGFFDSIPHELDESARVDGATPSQIFWGVILPLADPGARGGRAVRVRRRLQRVRDRQHPARGQRQAHPAGRAAGLHRPAVRGALGAVRGRGAARRDPRGAAVRLPAEVHRLRPHPGLRQGMTSSLLAEPHHDGSELYVPAPPRALGDQVTVRLRVPRALAVDQVALRYTHDGEPRVHGATVDEETETDQWWSVRFTAYNPVTRYRWLVAGGELGYAWVTGAGLEPFDVPDADDFTIAVGAGGPEWHLESVVYEIFPDRFASTGGAVGEPPEWAVRRGWDESPAGWGENTGAEWYGGDLRGIEERLDHLVALGVNVIYLTPIFPAGSTHRYDAVSFDHVDPLLGGDAALASLTAAAHERGLRVVGDLTLNHCGDGHDWFRAARSDEDAPERSFFLFDEDIRHGYETWLGVRTLPKLDYRSPELRRRLADGPTSVVQRWMREPFGLDGWRIDVANMTGRYRDVDVNLDVAALVRGAVTDARGDGLLIAEHGHDYRSDLRGDGWQGVMNYMGFLRPIWAWLRGDRLPAELADGFLGLPVGVPAISAHAAVASMRRFRAGVPWQAVLHSWTLLDSHDTARFGAVAGDRERHLVGVGLQMTTPGVPMVWAGDEIGVGGLWGEDARRPMPWDGRGRLGRRPARRLPPSHRAATWFRCPRPRRHPLRGDLRRRLRLPAREPARADPVPRRAGRARAGAAPVGGAGLRRGSRHCWVTTSRSTEGSVVLPAAGPAFHAWRLLS